ncbi:S9 family peptidase [Sinomicrobium pectinilyticum]|uniref:S9 family peptidase n=1 Tax=Sinomicrobium pectinilyticum TaxID=1084421 RepID=A0A3N0EQY0_SINP1|nr:prolyl oligopeptidase family serine peptidase [Sinomicrobium pectinilyticum]RNL90325.1 S9 family peptidase [Sinomicrobium pectinilyticum]
MNKSIYTSYPKFFLPTLLIILLFFTDPLATQNGAKKIYTPDLDSLWSDNTYIKKLSPNGDWVTYVEVFNNKENLLTLKNTSNSISHTFKDCNIADFSLNSKWFGGISGDRELILVDLVNHTKEVYPDILSRLFHFSKSGNYVAAYQKGDGTPDILLIVNLNTKDVVTISGVTEYQWHPVNDQLLLVKEQEGQKKVMRYEAKNGKSIDLIENRENDYRFLKWSDSGNAVFVDQQKDTNTLHYVGPDGSLLSLDDTTIATLGGGYRLSDREAYISGDGEKVLFYRQVISEKQEAMNPTMEVWNTDDPWIYPRKKFYEERELQYVLTAWYPGTGLLVPIETEKFPSAALNINHDYALVYNQLDYEPLYKYYPNADLYLKDMQTGKTRLVCKNQYTEGKFVTISPKGRYVVYFKNHQWWAYDTQKNQAVNLTSDIKVDFHNMDIEFAGDLYPYGNAGWLGEDDYIVLYDQFDIWLIRPDGKEKRRITRGREQNISYRVSREVSRNDFYQLTINQNFASGSLDISQGVLLKMFDLGTYKTGYALWQNDNSVKTITLQDLRLDKVLASPGNDILVYRKQKFDTPIGIYSYDRTTMQEHLIYQSNKELLDYDLGKAAWIGYTSPEGKPLKGVLVYPAGYDPNKKYPMISHIYERESKNILRFAPPSDYSMSGFNLLKYITNGYFVFYPDFTYTMGDPGISALECLTTGVEKALQTGRIDEGRLGLIGHSFGGYETAFIVTQTDMFSAAVAGAAATDLINWYHDVSWHFKMPQLWRIENWQWRMGTSFYNNKEGYYRNSALQHIENVNTPLMLWTGKLDTNVNWNQSVNMFMALKRLNKKSKMLLFEKEGHVISQREHQMILSREIFNWMERYVKGNS